MPLRRLVLCCVCACFIGVARAHTLPISYLVLVPDAEYLHLELTFNPFELSFARELDRNHNGRIDAQEWQDEQALICQRMLDCLLLRVNGRPVQAAISGITPDLDSHHATLRVHYKVDARTASVTIESRLASITSSSHLTQVTFGSTEPLLRAQLDTQSTSATFETGHGSANATPDGVPPLEGAAQRSWWRVPSALAAVLAISAIVVLFGRSWRPSNCLPAQRSSDESL